MKIHCATTNAGKLREFALAAGAGVEIAPVLLTGEPPEETGATFEENAALKAEYYSRQCEGLLFAEDSGLEVDALGGAPGIYSARFSPEGTDAANNALLLERLRGAVDRRARYVCAIAVAERGVSLAAFRGTVEGEMLAAPRGDGGFGYDPLFFYRPFGLTFAEVTKERKFEVSHRRRALDALFAWLRTRAALPE